MNDAVGQRFNPPYLIGAYLAVNAVPDLTLSRGILANSEDSPTSAGLGGELDLADRELASYQLAVLNALRLGHPRKGAGTRR